MYSLRYIAAGLIAFLFVAGCGVALWWVTLPSEPVSLELSTPALCLRSLPPSPGPLFFNLESLPFLKGNWQQWGAAFGSTSLLPEELAVPFDATTRNPQAWRVLDRKWHFGAVLLSGDPANFRPLLEHLRSSSDWKLTQIDPVSYLFQRNAARSWTNADLAPLLEVFAQHSVKEQHAARVQVAHRLLFVGELPAAQALLDEVLKADPDSIAAWTELASVHGKAGKWKESMEAADHALALDDHYRPARMAQANAFYALGRFDKALFVTRNLFQEAPADGQILLLHAKVSHAAHAYQEEIAVLQTMITAAQGASQPVGLLQIYLGQAYAAIGDGNSAHDQLEAALKDPGISADDRAFAQKALERFTGKTEFLNSVPSLPQSSLLDAPAGRP
jgi:predicted Zn-dependent protease